MQKQIFLTAAQVRERYGRVSRMWIYRRMEDSAFPTPVRFARLRYWRASDLEAWDTAALAKCVPASEYRPTPRRAARSPGRFGAPEDWKRGLVPAREDIRAFVNSHNAPPNARKSVRQRGV